MENIMYIMFPGLSVPRFPVLKIAHFSLYGKHRLMIDMLAYIVVSLSVVGNLRTDFFFCGAEIENVV